MVNLKTIFGMFLIKTSFQQCCDPGSIVDYINVNPSLCVVLKPCLVECVHTKVGTILKHPFKAFFEVYQLAIRSCSHKTKLPPAGFGWFRSLWVKIDI